jgi:hypothetical protein
MMSVHRANQYRWNLGLKWCHRSVRPCCSHCLMNLIRKLMGTYLLDLPCLYSQKLLLAFLSQK